MLDGYARRAISNRRRRAGGRRPYVAALGVLKINTPPRRDRDRIVEPRVSRKKWLLSAHANPPPRSVTQNPIAGFAMTFAHGAGGTRSPATSIAKSTISVRSPYPFACLWTDDGSPGRHAPHVEHRFVTADGAVRVALNASVMAHGWRRRSRRVRRHRTARECAPSCEAVPCRRREHVGAPDEHAARSFEHAAFARRHRHRHELVLQLLRVRMRLRVQDDEIGPNAFRAPVPVRDEQLSNAGETRLRRGWSRARSANRRRFPAPTAPIVLALPPALRVSGARSASCG